MYYIWIGEKSIEYFNLLQFVYSFNVICHPDGVKEIEKLIENASLQIKQRRNFRTS